MLRFVVMLFGTVALSSELETIKAVPDLDKRVQRALDEAAKSLTDARAAYEKDGLQAAQPEIDNMVACIEFVSKTLLDTGKPPTKNLKHYKRAELKSRELLRRLDTFVVDVSADEREPVEQARGRIRELHEEFLHSVMSRKR